MTAPGGMSSTVARMSQSYNSFSGVDIHVTMAGNPIGELQGVSYTVTREKAPLYTMGSPDPRSFSRGKRGIAGSLIFLVFDRSNLLEALGEKALFWADVADLTYLKQFTVDAASRTRGQEVTFAQAIQNSGQVPQAEEVRQGTVQRARAWYHDQIPPFDIVLTAINEYGHAARMVIKGVEILNAGSGISIDDITTDENMTFVATDIIPWQSLGWADPAQNANDRYAFGAQSNFAPAA
jgi:hypothetical protein